MSSEAHLVQAHDLCDRPRSARRYPVLQLARCEVVQVEVAPVVALRVPKQLPGGPKHLPSHRRGLSSIVNRLSVQRSAGLNGGVVFGFGHNSRAVSRVLDETRGCGRVCRRSREAYDALPESLALTLGDILPK